MKCPNCKKEYKRNYKICPSCKFDISNDDSKGKSIYIDWNKPRTPKPELGNYGEYLSDLPSKPNPKVQKPKPKDINYEVGTSLPIFRGESYKYNPPRNRSLFKLLSLVIPISIIILLVGIYISNDDLIAKTQNYITSVYSSDLDSLSIPPTSIPATSIPATSIPATSIPATSIPPTSIPATSIPATSIPATSIPPTSIPATSIPPTSALIRDTDEKVFRTLDEINLSIVLPYFMYEHEHQRKQTSGHYLGYAFSSWSDFELVFDTYSKDIRVYIYKDHTYTNLIRNSFIEPNYFEEIIRKEKEYFEWIYHYNKGHRTKIYNLDTWFEDFEGYYETNPYKYLEVDKNTKVYTISFRYVDTSADFPNEIYWIKSVDYLIIDNVLISFHLDYVDMLSTYESEESLERANNIQSDWLNYYKNKIYETKLSK